MIEGIVEREKRVFMTGNEVVAWAAIAAKITQHGVERK